MRYKNIIFDLDGTLVDSSSAIIDALNHAFEVCNLEPSERIDKSIIGPPIREIIQKLMPNSMEAPAFNLETEFKRYYDEVSYKNTYLFTEIQEVLDELAKTNINLYIVTNKRAIPAGLIIKLFNWENFFKSVFSLDSFEEKFKKKEDLLKKVLASDKLDKAATCYVGDRVEDGLASSINQIDFYMADWGYGSDEHDYPILHSPCEILMLAR